MGLYEEKYVYEYGNSRVKRMAESLLNVVEDKLYSKKEVKSLIEQIIFLDALVTLQDQLQRVPPNSLKDTYA